MQGTYLKGIDYLTVEKYNLKELTVQCSYCGAYQFSEQKGRTLHTYCQNGVVYLLPLNEYPHELGDLLKFDSEKAKHFKYSIRAYNFLFRFATFGAYFDDMHVRRPTLIKIGQVYHHATTSFANVGNNMPRNGQIYIYKDIEKAELNLVWIYSIQN